MKNLFVFLLLGMFLTVVSVTTQISFGSASETFPIGINPPLVEQEYICSCVDGNYTCAYYDTIDANKPEKCEGYIEIPKITLTNKAGYTFDNVVNFHNDIGSYGKVDIKGMFGLGQTIENIELKENTYSCGENCYAIKDITTYVDTKLVDGVVFDKLLDDGSWERSNIRSYQFYLKSISHEVEVNDYTTKCNNIGISENGTAIQECNQIVSGTHTEITPEWIPYNYEVLPAGSYTLKLVGEKRLDWTYDWKIISQGKMISDWATWGNISTGSQAEVRLNSPADGSTQYTRLVTTNATGNVTNGAYLTNGTLYDNSTGSWGARNSSAIVLNNSFTLSVGTVATESATPRAGLTFKVLSNTNLTSVKKSSSANPDIALLYVATTTSAGNNIANASFIGDYAYFNYPLNTSATYFILGGRADGGSYTRSYGASGVSYPQNNSQVNVTNAVILGSGGPMTDNFRNIERINTSITTNNVIKTFSNTYPSGSNIKWNMQFCDSDGACGFATANRTFSIDSQAPAVVLNYPTSLINYGALNGTLQLNLTATDTNLDKVWYNYNGTNISIAGAVSGVANLSNITLSTKKNVTIYANDTAGNLNTSVFSWDYIFFTNQTIYNPTSVSTSSETFTLVNVKHSSISSITARLWYAGVPYISTTTISGDNVNISNTIDIPVNGANRNFFWEIAAVGTGGTYNFNTTSLNQTVTTLSFASCTAPGTGLTLNFTTYDTTTMLPVNSSFEGTFSYFASTGTGNVLETYNYQNLSENRSNFMFCLNSSGGNVTIDGFLNYYKTGYDARSYILNNAIIGNFTQSIPLYLTATTLTDVVTFTVQDQNYDPLAGALVSVQKWNVGTNTFSTIGMFTTSSTGQGIMDLELYSTWYRVTVTYNGIIVATTDVQKLSTTTWTITVTLGVNNPYDLFGTISHRLSFDNVTNITTFYWMDSSGYVQEGCLTIKNSTNIGYVILSQQCTTSVAGTINYQLTPNSTYMVYGTINLIPIYNISQITDVLSIDLNGPTLLGKTISPFGKVISFIAIGTAGAIGIAAGSPILASGLVLLVIFGAWKIGWLLLSESIFWSIVITLLLILVKQSRRGE